MLQTATITKQETKEKPYRILFDVRSRSYQQWLECRQHFITGSDAGSLAHINKYCSARKIYMLKKGLLEKEKGTEQMKFGRLLEPIIRNEYRRITGYEVREIPYMLASTRYEWMAGNIDGAVLLPSKDGTKEWAVLEIKNLGFYTSSTEYAGGEPGYISPSHLAQLYHYMLLTGLRMSVLVTLQCGSKLTWQIVEFDDDTGNSLLALERDFFYNHLIKNVPPPVSNLDVDLLNQLYPKAVAEKQIELPAEAQDILMDYERANHDLAQAKEAKAEAEAKLKAMMADAEIATIGNYKISWKNVSTTRLNSTKIKSELLTNDDLLKEYSSTTVSRTFKVSAARKK